MADPEIIIVLGRRGQGKSTWTKRYTDGIARLVVWDPKRSYRVEYPADLAEWFEQHEADKSFRVGGFYDEDQETIGSLAYAMQDTTLVLEECAFVFSPNKPFPEWARECVYLGRERGVSVVAVAQRPKSVHIALRSQATRIICFNQHEVDDVDWITDTFGDAPVEEIPNLQTLECLDITATETRRYFVSHGKAEPKALADIPEEVKSQEEGEIPTEE